MTMTNRTNRIRTTEYSGAPFGRPNDVLPAFGDRASSTVLWTGQDSVTAADLQPGHNFYPFYATGPFSNGTAVKAHQPGKRYFGISPFVAPADCGDVEPGDMSIADAPQFVRANSTVPNLEKPMLYASAGDVQAMINACNSMGVPRSEYFVFSAHWIGLHLCSPGTCGYPAADATQYASTPQYDSDIANASIFKGVGPVPVPTPPVQTVITWQGSDGILAAQVDIPFEIWVQLDTKTHRTK